MIGVMAVIAWFVPTNYVVFAPGLTGNLAQMVKVQGKRAPATGRLLMVAISVMRANALMYGLARVDPTYELYQTNQVLPDMTMNQYVQFNYALMDQSQQAAQVAGEHAAGLPASAVVLPGVTVAGLLKNGAALHHLKVGDRIVKVGSQAVNIYNLRTVMMHYHVGEIVPFTVVRGHETLVIPLKLQRIPGDPAPAIGVAVGQAVRYTIPTPVQFNSQNIGGPSAGMMFALEIYEQITGKNLAGHRIVAGTGEITPGGTVLQIGGVGQKVITVHEAGATVFLCPAGNYQKALAMAKSRHYHLKIYPVKTLQQAIADLAQSS